MKQVPTQPQSDTKTTIKESSVDIKTKSVTLEQKRVNHPSTASLSQPDERSEIEVLAAEAEEAFASLERSGLANNQSVVDDPLSPKKIERLFKQPKDERSPFAS